MSLVSGHGTNLAELQWELSEAHSGMRFEILRGQLVLVNAASTRHDRLATQLGFLLHELLPDSLEYITAGAGVQETRDTTRPEYCQPDGVVALPIDPGLNLIGSAVVLAVEVISPSNRQQSDYRDAVVERAVRFGMGWVVFADPDSEGTDLRRAAASADSLAWLDEFIDRAATVVDRA